MARGQSGPQQADATAVREWARGRGFDVGDRGRFSTEIVDAFNKSHKNMFYPGGSQGGSTQTATRTPRSSGDSRTTRRAPASTTSTETAPAPRQRRSSASRETAEVATAVISPAGMGISEQQMEQFNRMLADANAVTGIQNELTIVRLTPAMV